MKFTNTQKGPRGINTVAGTILVDPDQTVDVDVFEREREHLEASGWFTIEGSYSSNPDGRSSAAPASSPAVDASELEDLKRQLAERDAELAKLKDDKPTERDELKKQADELGLQYPGNISNVKLKELIDAKLAE
jgi:hypothetical protein